MACLEGRNFTIKLYPRKKFHLTRAGGWGSIGITPNFREKLGADAPVHGERSSSEEEKREAGGHDKQGEFEVGEAGTGINEVDCSRHEDDDEKSGETGCETEKKKERDRHFGDNGQGCEQRSDSEAGGTGHLLDRIRESSAPEPSESFLAGVEEENGHKSHAQEYRRNAWARFEKCEYRVACHGLET